MEMPSCFLKTNIRSLEEPLWASCSLYAQGCLDIDPMFPRQACTCSLPTVILPLHAFECPLGMSPDIPYTLVPNVRESLGI